MKRIALVAAVVLLAGVAQAQDLLIFGGPIHTAANAPTVQAVLVKDGKVAFTGPLADAEKQAGDARRINLKGAAAYPGFTDAHAHLTDIGLREMSLDLAGAPSLAAAVDALAAYAKAHPTGPIIGGGWIETHWPEKRFPTRQDLDRAVPDRPVMLSRADGHGVLFNSAAIKLAGVTRDTPDPKGGRILKDAQGEPNGMFLDFAADLVRGKLPAVTPAVKTQALERAGKLYAARGWTAVGNMLVSGEDLGLIEALAAQGKMPIRSDNYLTPNDAGPVLKAGPSQDATGLVRLRGIKMFADGALGSRGAALLAPYSDDASSGLVLMTHDEALGYMRQAAASGAQVAMHAIGDRGNRLTLDWMQEAFKADPAAMAKARWRIEHAQILSPADLPRLGKLGIVASMQPSHAIGDLYFAPARLGEDRLKGAYAWADIVKSGAVMAGGSDAPVEVGDPLIEFYAAVARRDLKGNAGADWHPEEAISRDQALAMFTQGAAFAAFRDDVTGTLEPGKKADITVFSKDIMTVPAPEILTAKPVLTVVDGKVVFEASSP